MGARASLKQKVQRKFLERLSFIGFMNVVLEKCQVKKKRKKNWHVNSDADYHLLERSDYFKGLDLKLLTQFTRMTSQETPNHFYEVPHPPTGMVFIFESVLPMYPQILGSKFQSTISKQLQMQQRGDHLWKNKNSLMSYLITLFETLYSNWIIPHIQGTLSSFKQKVLTFFKSNNEVIYINILLHNRLFRKISLKIPLLLIPA